MFCAPFRHQIGGLLALALAWLAPEAFSAGTNFFQPVADTSLLEVAPSNNHGGFFGMNSGTTQNFKRTRAVFRFDLSSLPTNTVVQSAVVQLAVTRQPDEPSPSITFGLHRMLRPWGEGDKNPAPTSPGSGSGLPASPGEATWNFAFFSTNAWSTPGGASGIDFSATESSFTQVYGVDESPYRFENSPEMIADVAAWIVEPQHNFGWLLLCNEEHLNFTARRWGTREDANNPPLLELEFLVPPVLQIVKPNPTQTELHFPAWAEHHYEVRYRDSLTTGTWLTLTNLPAAPTNYAAIILDSASVTQRFYRVSAY
jgi:hypothetical protein